MTKPSISTFNTIAPLIIQKYERYLPTAFDETLSILEKMNKIINYLGEIGEIANEFVDQWNAVADWVMGEGLTDAVADKLDEFAANGMFDQFMSDAILAIGANVRNYGAKGDGVTDDTAAIQAAINTGNPVYFPKPSVYYRITDTLYIKTSGQILYANDRIRGMVQNDTNYKQLVVFGDVTTTNGAVQQAGIRNIGFRGNASSIGGIRLDGKVSSGNPSWVDASKDCFLDGVCVDNIGSGWALEVYSWANEITNFTAYEGNRRGILMAKEHNQNTLSGIYLTGCAEQSFQTGDGTGTSGRGNILTGIVVQQSGGAEGCIVLSEVDNMVMNGVYLESNSLKGAPVPLMIKDTAYGISIKGVNNLGGGALVIRNQGKGNVIQGVISSNVTGTIVENSGNGKLIAEGIEWIASATATVPKFSDLSTNKTGMFLDTDMGFWEKMRITGYTPLLDFVDLSSGAYAWRQIADANQIKLTYDIENDGIYEGTAWRFNPDVPEMVFGGSVRPENDNVNTSGTSTRRWANVFSNGYNMGLVASSGVSNNTLFIDTADGLLKFKNNLGTIKTVSLI